MYDNNHEYDPYIEHLTSRRTVLYSVHTSWVGAEYSVEAKEMPARKDDALIEASTHILAAVNSSTVLRSTASVVAAGSCLQAHSQVVDKHQAGAFRIVASSVPTPLVGIDPHQSMLTIITSQPLPVSRLLSVTPTQHTYMHTSLHTGLPRWCLEYIGVREVYHPPSVYIHTYHT